MFTVKTRILLFAIAGLISGVISGMGQFILPDDEIFPKYYPAVILGIFLYLAGRYLANIKTSNDIFSLIILIIASIAGWRLSINVGFDLGGPVPFVSAGTLGAFVVALGWLFAWKIRFNILIHIIIITVSGALGGLVFQFADSMIQMTEEMWVIFLFTEWQCILLLGIALAHSMKKGI